MAPELLNTIDARELVSLGQQIRAYQQAKDLSDNAMVKKFAGLGSTKTYSRVLNDDLSELDLEKQLANYRAVWAVIESVGTDEETSEQLSGDLTGVRQVSRAILTAFKHNGLARFILVEGDTGTGKTSVRRLLLDQYGQRILCIEAADLWNDNPNAFLGEILRALGVKEVPQLATDRLRKVLERLNETRVCIFIDEFHHLGPRCLNTVKTIINQSPGEIVGLAMPTLMKRIEREAYEECRQLTGNRLADRITLEIREGDLIKIIKRRIPAVNGELSQVVRMLMDRTAKYGNLAFVRDVCTRVVELSEGTDGPNLDCWSTAISQEVASR
jgi:DNA transposition AAA+ family ATPase